MPAPKITKLPRASIAGAVLFIMAGLMLSVTQARAETVKVQTVATSLAEVTLEPGTKLLVILGNGEKVKGEATSSAEGALSIYTYPDGIRKLDESEIYQIYQVKGISRGKGALIGAGIGAAGALLAQAMTQEHTALTCPICAVVISIPTGIGAAIGARVVSGEQKRLLYQNPTVSPPSTSKTGLLNFRDGRLSFAVPSIYLQKNRFDGFRVKPFDKRTLIKKIDLVRVDF